MVLTVRNNINENLPPSATKRVSRGALLQESTRRRRHRVSGSPTGPSTCTSSVAEQARRRRIQSVVAPEEPAQTRTLSLPSVLQRPEPCYDTIPKNLYAIGEDWLLDTPVDYVRDQLLVMGPDMLECARLARPVDQMTTGPIPSSVTLSVPAPDMCLPTHVFALYSSTAAVGGQKPKLTFYPVHNVIFSAHCAFLPALPTSSSVQIVSPSEARVEVPVVPLRLPSPGHFTLIHHYLYTKRASDLLAGLLPIAPSPALLAQLLNARLDPVDSSVLKAFSQTLKANAHPSRIMKSLLDVNGVWKNTCALGILDEMMWDTLDLAWTILLGALPKAA